MIMRIPTALHDRLVSMDTIYHTNIYCKYMFYDKDYYYYTHAWLPSDSD